MKIFERFLLQPSFINIFWSGTDFLARFFYGVILHILLAKYFGPEQYGYFSFSLVIYSLFLTISKLSMDVILTKELNIDKSNLIKIKTTSFYSMVLFSFINFILLIYLSRFFDSDVRFSLFCFSLCLLFTPFLLQEFDYQSKEKFINIFKIRTFCLILSLILKVFLIESNHKYQTIIISFIFDTFLITITYLFLSKKEYFNLFKDFDLIIFKNFIKKAFYLVSASIITMLFMRTDILFIKFFLTPNDLGYYMLAVKIFEANFNLIASLSIACLPFLTSKYREKFFNIIVVKLFSFFFWTGLAISLIMYFLSFFIIDIFFGNSYYDSLSSLRILCMGLSFTSLSSILYRVIVVKGLEHKIFIRSIYAFFLNFLLNFFLVPIYGIEGAALSTLISLIFISILYNYIDSDMIIFRRFIFKGIFFRFK